MLQANSRSRIHISFEIHDISIIIHVLKFKLHENKNWNNINSHLLKLGNLMFEWIQVNTAGKTLNTSKKPNKKF